MSEYRPELPEVPQRMRSLPIRRGYPVPWFVAEVDGDYHFPTADGRKFAIAVRKRLCWVCGQPLGKRRAFVIGPMCAINKTTSEPPTHRECAIFSATACPFLSRPHMKRQKEMPEGAKPPPGMHIMRNPGATLVWVCKEYWLRQVPQGDDGSRAGYLFKLGPPIEVAWYAQGRLASREEVMESITSGLPILRQVAEQHGEQKLLDLAYADALRLVPPA